MLPPVAPQHRYHAVMNHRQTRSSELTATASCCNMAPSSSHSVPCVTQRRPPIAELLQPACDAAAAASEEPAEAAGTSTHQSDQAAARAADESTRRGDEPAEAAEKKTDRAAEDAGVSYGGGAEPARRPPAAAATEEMSSRDRLKRHRTEMAGRVRIPDMWGQERLLKDWVDCAVFDRPLAATAGLLNARDALIAECAAARRSAGRPLRVQNGCS